MATLSAVNPTLFDYMQALDPNDQVAAVIELLSQQNEILADATLQEGNLLTGPNSTIRTGIPTPTWRKMYGGVQPSKTTRVKVTDTCGMLENYAEVDKALADLNGNTAAFRLSESMGILEGFNQKVASSLFYSNEDTEPEAFTGLAPRFNAIATGSPQNGDHVIEGGGTGSTNTSVWLVVWGVGANLIYPKGSKAGIYVEDKGQVTIENADGSNGRMEAYRTHFRWDLGLQVPDWRYIVRVANVDVTTLTKNAASGADIIDLMTQALEICQGVNVGRPAFYVGRTIKSFLRRQMVNKVAAGTLTMGEVAGKPVMMFGEVPVRRCDALLNTEARIT